MPLFNQRLDLSFIEREKIIPLSQRIARCDLGKWQREKLASRRQTRQCQQLASEASELSYFAFRNTTKVFACNNIISVSY